MTQLSDVSSAHRRCSSDSHISDMSVTVGVHLLDDTHWPMPLWCLLVNNEDQITHGKIAAWRVSFLSSLQCGQVIPQPSFPEGVCQALCLTPAFAVLVLLFEYVKWKTDVRLKEQQFFGRQRLRIVRVVA